VFSGQSPKFTIKPNTVYICKTNCFIESIDRVVYYMMNVLCVIPAMCADRGCHWRPNPGPERCQGPLHRDQPKTTPECVRRGKGI
jgi:hypothetical protein